MKLKRVYREDSRGRKKVAGIEIQRLPTNGRKHFSMTLVKAGKDEGWLSVVEDGLIIHSANIGDVVFELVDQPYEDGRPLRRCTVCNEVVASEPRNHPKAGEAAREHIRTMHPDFTPTAKNPGYVVKSYYDCVQLSHLEDK